MTVLAWRVVRRKYAVAPNNPFDGEGSRQAGGRWNSPGVPVVYTSATVSLAVLETLVHAENLVALRDRVVFRVAFPDDLMTAIDVGTLPPDWNRPVALPQLRVLGDEWVRENRTPVLRVPSAVVAVEDNYILNPRHPRFADVAVGALQPLPIDPRLLGVK